MNETASSLWVKNVLFAQGLGGFFYDDQAAIRKGREMDGFTYRGEPVTEGFVAVRMPARCLSIGLRLSDDEIVWGDMMSVQYAGAAGRDPVFSPATAEQFITRHMARGLIGVAVASFTESCAATISGDQANPTPLAIAYGLSQALLRAAARSRRRTMAEVICEEFGCRLSPVPVPLYAQSGDAREINVDKMILKRVDILPHGLINSRGKFGKKGETFLAFVNWVARRVEQLGDPGYSPVLHFDIYGWAGLEFGLDAEAIAEFITRAAMAAAPFRLNIECPADYGSLEAQLEGYAAIVRAVDATGCGARIVADEWCNTLSDIVAFAERRAAHIVQIKTPDLGDLRHSINAVLACKKHGVGAYLGGSCVETDLSARASVHVAVATQADMMLAKPGMGVDEGLSITANEQNRLLATLSAGGGIWGI